MVIFIHNRRGWIRIVEALIAIMIIATAILLITPRNPNPDVGGEIHNKQRAILETMARNDSFRSEIITLNSRRTGNCRVISSSDACTLSKQCTFMNFIKKNLPATLDYAATICNIYSFNNTVLPPNCVTDLYVSDTILSINITGLQTSQTKVQLYSWLKNSCV